MVLFNELQNASSNLSIRSFPIPKRKKSIKKTGSAALGRTEKLRSQTPDKARLTPKTGFAKAPKREQNGRSTKEIAPEKGRSFSYSARRQ